MSASSRSLCGACQAKVTWAKFPDGITRPIEPCPEGEGSVAIQPNLPGLGEIGGRIEARIVSGVRTSWRPHLESCSRAHVYRSRWQTDRRCGTCNVPMVALENGRSICASCQAAEATRLEKLAGELRDRVGPEGAQALIAGALSPKPRGSVL